MGETEIKRFLIIGTLILIVLITCVIMFILEYRRKTILNEREKQLAKLEMQQKTMQYIAREIHDNVGQKLTLASLYAQALDYKNRYPDINERILTIVQLIDDSLAELKNLSRTLINEHIDHKDIIDLMKEECQKINSLNLCSIVFYSNVQEIKTSYHFRDTLIKIIKEIFQNTLKHAKCTTIEVTVNRENEGVYITVADNGVGFDLQQCGNKGMGLSNIKERAHDVGASVEISSIPGDGTTIKMFLPEVS